MDSDSSGVFISRCLRSRQRSLQKSHAALASHRVVTMGRRRLFLASLAAACGASFVAPGLALPTLDDPIEKVLLDFTFPTWRGTSSFDLDVFANKAGSSPDAAIFGGLDRTGSLPLDFSFLGPGRQGDPGIFDNDPVALILDRNFALPYPVLEGSVTIESGGLAVAGAETAQKSKLMPSSASLILLALFAGSLIAAGIALCMRSRRALHVTV